MPQTSTPPNPRSSTVDRLNTVSTAAGQQSLSANSNVSVGLSDLILKTAISNERNHFRAHYGWQTHSEWFNEVFGGISTLTTIAGTPGSGKSSAARSLCVDFLRAHPDNKVLYLSGEDRKADLEQLVVSRIINFNRRMWYKPLKGHPAGQFPLHIAKRLSDFFSSKDDMLLFSEFNSILQRFETKTKGDKVFKSKESFENAIAASIFKNCLGDNPINELLVVVDHLGEFDLAGNYDGDYSRTNEVLDLIMEITGIEEGEYVTDFKTLTAKSENANLQKVFDIAYNYLEEYLEQTKHQTDKKAFMERLTFPKIKFIIISQLKSDANQNFGKNTIKPWFWTDGTLGGSKKIGEKSEQVIFLWKLEGFGKKNGALPESYQTQNKLYGSSQMGMMKVAKNRCGEANVIIPYFMNFGTNELKIPPCSDLISPGEYEDWLKKHELHPQSEGDKLIAMDRYVNGMKNNAEISTWMESYRKNGEEQKKFRDLFQLESLKRYM